MEQNPLPPVAAPVEIVRAITLGDLMRYLASVRGEDLTVAPDATPERFSYVDRYVRNFTELYAAGDANSEALAELVGQEDVETIVDAELYNGEGDGEWLVGHLQALGF